MCSVGEKRVWEDNSVRNVRKKCVLRTSDKQNDQSLKLDSFLQRTPHEIILKILEHLCHEDMKSLVLANKRIRWTLLPYFFEKVKIGWEELLDTWQDCGALTVPISDAQLIEKLRITTACSKNEWTFPFERLFSHDAAESRMSNLRSLQLTTSGSTSFFKYCNTADKLKELKVAAQKKSSIFSMCHVRCLPSLRHLELADFHIETFDEDSTVCPLLTSLQLENCTWCFPFNLESFGKDKVTSLRLTYSDSFVASERFRKFLSDPGFTRLQELCITNNERNLKLTLSVQVITLIKKITTLKVLKLVGNVYNETLNQFTQHDLANCIHCANSRDVKVLYSSFARDSS
ncbi:LAMI_0G07492g1_1 [Lachancea mirantina]|uniref:LAMI_0G07492g1_1 n=1 Tax=Lachancea mirantina TaxID=1230905 RepID=A0A1G4K9S2_9SACH|nr:LAMI_0G07492g1_1 [Lachancea mirantina]